MLNCRVCLQENTLDAIKVFSSNLACNQVEVTIHQAFQECTQLECQPDDKLCKRCYELLKDSYNFLLEAKKSSVKLKFIKIEQQYEDLKVDGLNIKDPLEEAIDDATENVDDLTTKLVNSDTDEDNKPLISFIKAPETIFSPNSKSNDNTAGLSTITLPEDDEQSDDFFEQDNTFTQSIEEQIFPQGSFSCNVCQKTYFTATGLNAHHDVHLPKSLIVKKRRLRATKKRDHNSSSTEEHFNKSTLPEDSPAPSNRKKPKPIKLFPCQFCGKQMISASKLRYHMVMHTGEKNFLCTMCPKAYSTIYALIHHMRTHTGERPYECKFCGDRFLRPTTLKSHMRRHTGERPYGCEICGKRFIQHSSMATHMKLNHMAKTIACPHCDKKYARKTDLNTHLLSHTGDKPFACQLCSSRFIRQANLNKHMNQHHAGSRITDLEGKDNKKNCQSISEELKGDQVLLKVESTFEEGSSL